MSFDFSATLTLLTTFSVVIIFCPSNISVGNHPSVLNPFGLHVADSTSLFPGTGDDPNLINQIFTTPSICGWFRNRHIVYTKSIKTFLRFSPQIF